MRKISKTKTKENNHYRLIYCLWRNLNKNCEVCGANVEYGIAPHHKKGRAGKRLTETEYWMCVCQRCHDRIEKNRKWALEKGYLLTR
jgi:hypothetical protein